MEDLVKWLGDQFDEDELEARRGYLKAEPLPDYDGWDRSTTAALPPAVAARVLREIDAKRKLLTRWCELQDRIDAEPNDAKRGNLALTRHGLDMFVYQVGSVYADRPGYRAEWRP
ncbi:DUF6221 family protein [Streptomyces sp. NPDC051315]|uniref:DUF6221 family protein n=1 Tax=Streptomyces sp. NPDC051315 TaxID=3365650 RepID=UPI00378F7C52